MQIPNTSRIRISRFFSPVGRVQEGPYNLRFHRWTALTRMADTPPGELRVAAREMQHNRRNLQQLFRVTGSNPAPFSTSTPGRVIRLPIRLEVMA